MQLAFSNQNFNGDDRYISNGRKVLYWRKNASNQWRIVREVFQDRRFERLHFTSAELAKLGRSLESSGDQGEVGEPTAMGGSRPTQDKI